MSTQLRIEVRIPMNRDAFWNVFFTKQYDDFQAPFIALKRVEELESEMVTAEDGTPKILKRKVKVVPNVELPSALLYFVGQEEFHYHDTQEKILDSYVVKTVTIPPVMQDRVKITNTHSLELVEGSPDECKLVSVIDIEVNAFGFGSIVESFLANGCEESSYMIPIAARAWLEKEQNVTPPTNLYEYIVEKMTIEDFKRTHVMFNGEPRKRLVHVSTQQQQQEEQPQQQSTENKGWFSSFW